ELRPRRVRDAQRLWQAVQAARGPEGRDAVWAHPDLIPTTADLDDPIGFSSGERDEDQTRDWDDDLARLLEQDRHDDGPADPDSRGSGDTPGPTDH
ncbi:hydrolase, partial [Propionibacterium freudenreichii]